VRSLATLKSEVYGGIRLHAHLRATTETIEGYPSEYCAVFYLSVVDSLNRDLAWQRDFKQSTSSISGDTEFFDITNEGDNLDKSMFVGIINISEKRQRRVPCLIRLHTLDDCPLIVSQTNAIASNAFGSYRSDIPSTSLFESTFTITDREVDRLVKSGILENPELPEQMVKCGTQVVAGISNEHRKLCRDVFKLLKPEHALSFITIYYNIVTDSVRLTLQKPLHQVINDLEMFICSAEFEKRAIQRVHILKYPQGETNGEKDTKDSKGTRGTRAYKGRIRARRLPLEIQSIAYNICTLSILGSTPLLIRQSIHRNCSTC
jgi:hypothetical protein